MRVVRPTSIPHVSTERLHDSLNQIHETTHTSKGIRAHDDTRRSLVNRGMRGKHIAAELQRRGEADRPCIHCAPNPPHIGHNFTENKISLGQQKRNERAAAPKLPRTQASIDAEARSRAAKVDTAAAVSHNGPVATNWDKHSPDYKVSNVRIEKNDADPHRPYVLKDWNGVVVAASKSHAALIPNLKGRQAVIKRTLTARAKKAQKQSGGS